MEIHIHIHHHGDPEVAAALSQIKHKLDIVIAKENIMSQELVDLTQEVEDTKTVEQSAIVAIQGIEAQLIAAGTDPVKLAALKDGLATNRAALAAAIAAIPPGTP